MLKIRYTLKGGKLLMTRTFDDERYATYLFDQFSRWNENPELEQIDLMDADFDFVISTKYNMKVKRHYTVTCKGNTQVFFDYPTAREVWEALENFFGRDTATLKTIN